jgi:hypothetical protein
VGKVVALVNVINNPPDWQALEIRFTDGTLLHFEFSTTHTQISRSTWKQGEETWI